MGKQLEIRVYSGFKIWEEVHVVARNIIWILMNTNISIIWVHSDVAKNFFEAGNYNFKSGNVMKNVLSFRGSLGV